MYGGVLRHLISLFTLLEPELKQGIHEFWFERLCLVQRRTTAG